MRIKPLLPITLTLCTAMWGSVASATEVTLTLNTISKAMTFTPTAGGEAVNTGEPTTGSNPAYKFSCDPGDYLVSLTDANGVPTGSIVLTVEGESQDKTICNVSFYVANKTDGAEWKLGTDYDIPFDRISVSAQKGGARTATPVKYTNKTRTTVTVPVFRGDSYEAFFIPLGANAESYAPSTMSGTITSDRNVSCTLPAYVDFSLTAPKDASVIVAEKPGSRHYVPFTQHDPQSAIESGNDMVYTYRLPQSSNYNYRVSRKGNITHAGIFNPSEGNITVSDADLSAYPSDYYNHDVTVNNGYNYADIYLNINPQGHLFMKPGGEFQLVNLRTWQLTNSTIANYFLEPDYHYTVLNTDFKPDNSVVTVDETGLLKARSEGTAIVQVRYDAIKAELEGGNLWSSIWAENTGTFIVTVGDKAEGIRSNMRLPYEQPNRTGEIDAEHDVFYYPEGETGYDFTFTPEGVSAVTVANPSVDLTANTLTYPDGFSAKNVTKNSDGSYTVHLTFGRNIVRLTDAAGKSAYQVVSAKPVSYTVSREGRDDKYILPGDKVVVSYKGLYHAAGKLAAIYNQGCGPQYATIPAGYDDNSVRGTGGQYNFASNVMLNVTVRPDQKAGKFEVSDGRLWWGGWGDKLGGHRDIDYLTGRNPNFTAVAQNQVAGVIPGISFDTDDFTDGMELFLRLEYGKKVVPVSLEAAKVFLGDDMTITSSDESIAAVDANGKVTAGKDGTATITYASAAGDRKFTCKVEVWSVKVEGLAFKDPVFDISSSINGYSIISLKLLWTPANCSNKDVTYKFSNPDVVELRNGKNIYTIKGVAGETDVTAISNDGGYTATCHVILRMGLSSLSLDKKEASLTVGETLALNPVYYPENTDPKFRGVIWTSSDPKVASVNENGLVTALAEGTATIQATSDRNEYMYGKCTVTVSAQSGIENVNGTADVKAWPNPFTDYIVVESPVATTAGIYNLQGSLLISTKVEAGQNRIDTSLLAPGLYLVRAGAETVKMIRK